MKKVIITGATKITPSGVFRDGLINVKSITIKGLDTMQISDGSHTMNELYDHRIELFIALCRFVQRENEMILEHDKFIKGFGYKKEDIKNCVWRSKLHSDGSSYDDWFILGIGKEEGLQATYHLPIERWKETDFAETLDRAPEWDGHTPADVLERLRKL